MQGYGDESYGDAHADIYDAVNEDPADAVAVLASLAGGGPVLDVGAGTGRLAAPLATLGLDVHAVEISSRMAEKIADKPGGDRVRVSVADMSTVALDPSYSLIYIAQGSLHSLLQADLQEACLRRLADRLAPDGHLVVESLTLDQDRFVHDQYVEVNQMSTGHVVLSAAIRAPEAQTVDVQSVLITEDGIRLFPLRYRYYDVDELDAMAHESGLTLCERWSGWDRAPEKPDQRAYVSVYTLARQGDW